MRFPRPAILVMASAHLLLFFLLILLWDHNYFSWMNYSRMTVSASQGCLLGIWVALGGKSPPWRVIAATGSAAGWTWYMAGLLSEGPVATAISALVDEMFLVTGILLLARFMGLRLDKRESGSYSHPGHLQFSVGQALLWMTALAVFMGATYYLKDCFGMYFNKREVCFPASCLTVGLAVMWLVCGRLPSDIKIRRDRIMWVGNQCFAVLFAIFVGAEWIRRVHGQSEGWEDVYMLACEAAITAASLYIVRLAGHRLTWHWPFRRPKPDKT
jgi:hypothetical protein